MFNISINSSIMENEIGQGRTERQYKDSLKIVAISLLGAIITIILLTLFEWESKSVINVTPIKKYLSTNMKTN